MESVTEGLIKAAQRMLGSCIRHLKQRLRTIVQQVTPRVQGRIKGGQRGQLPRAPRCKGAPRDEIYLFQIKYSFEKFL